MARRAGTPRGLGRGIGVAAMAAAALTAAAYALERGPGSAVSRAGEEAHALQPDTWVVVEAGSFIMGSPAGARLGQLSGESSRRAGRVPRATRGPPSSLISGRYELARGVL